MPPDGSERAEAARAVDDQTGDASICARHDTYGENRAEAERDLRMRLDGEG
jgi:hypothetical protein